MFLGIVVTRIVTIAGGDGENPSPHNLLKFKPDKKHYCSQA
jgi:hypothetical protein